MTSKAFPSPTHSQTRHRIWQCDTYRIILPCPVRDYRLLVLCILWLNGAAYCSALSCANTIASGDRRGCGATTPSPPPSRPSSVSLSPVMDAITHRFTSSNPLNCGSRVSTLRMRKVMVALSPLEATTAQRCWNELSSNAIEDSTCAHSQRYSPPFYVGLLWHFRVF